MSSQHRDVSCSASLMEHIYKKKRRVPIHRRLLTHITTGPSDPDGWRAPEHVPFSFFLYSYRLYIYNITLSLELDASRHRTPKHIIYLYLFNCILLYIYWTLSSFSESGPIWTAFIVWTHPTFWKAILMGLHIRLYWDYS